MGNGFYFMLNKPLCGFGIATREIIEENVTIGGEIFMPAGIDDYEIALFNLGLGIVEVFLANDIPFLKIAHVDDYTLAIAARQGHFINAETALENMQRGIHMGRNMHFGLDNGGHFVDAAFLGIAGEGGKLREGDPGDFSIIHYWPGP